MRNYEVIDELLREDVEMHKIPQPQQFFNLFDVGYVDVAEVSPSPDSLDEPLHLEVEFGGYPVRQLHHFCLGKRISTLNLSLLESEVARRSSYLGRVNYWF